MNNCPKTTATFPKFIHAVKVWKQYDFPLYKSDVVEFCEHQVLRLEPADRYIQWLNTRLSVWNRLSE